MAALLGLVPKQVSTGGRTTLLGITKKGDPYLRSLLIHGARAHVRAVKNRPKTPQDEWLREKVHTKGVNKASVAYANKVARILWAMLARGQEYRMGT